VLKGGRGRITAVAFTSWCTTVIAAIVCAGELVWSGTALWNTAFPAMAGIHILIGIGEAIITALVIAAISKARPELLYENSQSSEEHHSNGILIYGILVIVGIAIFVVPFASPWPDGLEKVAASLGFEHKIISQPLLSSPMADYQIHGMASLTLATILSGLIGAIVVFGLSYVLARVLVPKSSQHDKDHPYAS
jgi:cobalt/nickel transport system permease protein